MNGNKGKQPNYQKKQIINEEKQEPMKIVAIFSKKKQKETFRKHNALIVNCCYFALVFRKQKETTYLSLHHE
jgi:hypothetical protein